MAVPEWPPRVNNMLIALGLGDLYRWWQAAKVWFNAIEARVDVIDGGTP